PGHARRRSDVACGAAAGGGPRTGRWPALEPDALRAPGLVGEGPRPGPARGWVVGVDAATRGGLHRGRAPLVRRDRGHTARPPRRGRADRLGLPAPVSARRDAP